jgi:hypothetical protein
MPQAESKSLGPKVLQWQNLWTDRNIGLVELFQEFVAFVVDRELMVPVAYHDSLLVVSLVTKDGGVPRMKDLRARMNVGKEGNK